MTDEPIYTREARLLAAGWPAPDEMARPILQREALYAALAELSAHNRSEDPLLRPVMQGDPAGIVAAVTAHALGAWCDGELQRFDSRVYYLAGFFLNQVSKEIAKDPEGVLASLSEVDDLDGDAAAIVAEARGYLSPSGSAFSMNTGRQVTAKAYERGGEVVPRQIRPLVSKANIERAERLGKANRRAMTAATIATLTKR